MFFTRDILDKTFYEHIRLAVVAAGWYPDERAFALTGDAAGFVAAKNAIRTAKKRLIEVIGMGAGDDRAEYTVSRIIVERDVRTPGTIGTSGVTFLEQASGSGPTAKFDKKRYPDQTSNLRYKIRLIAEDEYMLAVMQDIMDDIFGERRHIPSVDPVTAGFTMNMLLLEKVGEVNMGLPKNIEYVYMFLVRDVYLSEAKTVQSGIPALTDVSGGAKLPETSGTISINITP